MGPFFRLHGLPIQAQSRDLILLPVPLLLPHHTARALSSGSYRPLVLSLVTARFHPGSRATLSYGRHISCFQKKSIFVTLN
jgi:hypothetical protein